MHRYSTLALLSAAALTAGAAAGAPSHGSLIITQNNASNEDFNSAAPAVTISVLASTGDFTAFNANRGDIDFEFAPGLNDLETGVLIGNGTELSRDNSAFGDATAGENYVTTFVDYSLNSGSVEWDFQPFYFMPIETTGGSALGDSAEFNMNVAVSFFRYDEYLTGYADNRGLIKDGDNGTPIDALTGASMTGIVITDNLNTPDFPDPGSSPGAELFDDATTNGIYTLDMAGLTAPTTGTAATPQNGVLLVTGGKNEDNYALSGDNGDGTFSVFVKDNNSNGSSTEQDPFAFAYVPLNDPGTVAVGRIDGDGDTIIGSGSFSMTYDGEAQQFLLTSPGQTNRTATLIISPERDDDNAQAWTVDNIVAYEYSLAAGGWLIETRDLTGASLQTLDPTDPAFSFALFGGLTAEPIAGDADGDGDVDNSDLQAAISNFTGPQTTPPTFTKTVAEGDNNGDGAVSNTDLQAAISNFTGPIGGAPVPEPAGLALLGMGGLLIARRRRSA